MSIEEVIRKLEEMAEDREDILPGCLGWDEAEPLREAITLLKTHQEARPNEPLTLEELRGMDGEVAWCNEYKCWGLISVERNVKREGIPFFNMSRKGCRFTYSIKRRKLTIYRRPPKEN